MTSTTDTMTSIIQKYQKEIEVSGTYAPETRRAVVSDIRSLYEYMQDSTEEKFGNSSPDTLTRFKSDLIDFIIQGEKSATKKRRVYSFRLLLKYMVDQGATSSKVFREIDLSAPIIAKRGRKPSSSSINLSEDTGKSSARGQSQDDHVPEQIISSQKTEALISAALVDLRDVLDSFNLMLLSELLSGVKPGEMCELSWSQVKIDSALPGFVIGDRFLPLSHRIPMNAFIMAVKLGRANQEQNILTLTPSGTRRRFMKMVERCDIGQVLISDLRWRCKLDLVAAKASSENIASILGISLPRVSRWRKALEEMAESEQVAPGVPD